MNNNDRIVLKGLGIKTGAIYSVVPVKCMETTCVSFGEPTNCGKECGAIGLLDNQEGIDMDCPDYKTAFDAPETRKRVHWQRTKGGAR